MSITSETVQIAHVKRAVDLTAAGQTAAQVAVTLQAEGVPVPRETADHRLLRYPHGYVFATEPATPGRWTAAAVTALLATPEADPADTYAVARSRLGTTTTTRLTVD